MPGRRSTPALVLTLLVAAVGACGGGDDGGRGDGGGGAGAVDDPDGFAYEAARACSDVLNERDGDEVAAGRQAGLDAVLWAMGGDEPSADERTAGAEAIEAYRAELERTRDELARLDPGGDDAAAWDDLLALFDAPLDGLAVRAEQARTGEGESTPGEFEVDDERLAAALEDLQLVGRDCEVVFAATGPTAEHRDFVVAAAEACTTIVSRRRAGGFEADAERVLAAVAQVVEGDAVGTGGGLAEALAAVEAEWEATVDDLAAVPEDDVPAPDEWATTLAAAEERIEIARVRGEALASGDEAELAAAFEPGALMDHPSFGDLGALGLDRRDCRSIAP